MCGRFGLFSELDELAEQFNFAPTIVRDIYQPPLEHPAHDDRSHRAELR